MKISRSRIFAAFFLLFVFLDRIGWYKIMPFVLQNSDQQHSLLFRYKWHDLFSNETSCGFELELGLPELNYWK